ncbi:UNVERIFIED_CONTAM: hypothetical protein HDU68_005549, partial [Siphonaria sp. JEL0065]
MSLNTPVEISQRILEYLPIDQNLKNVGFASKPLFAGSVFFCPYFASAHLSKQLNELKETKYGTVWSYFSKRRVGSIDVIPLPLTYQLAVLTQMLLTKSPIVSHSDLAICSIPLSKNKGLLLFESFLANHPDFDWGSFNSQSVSLACSVGWHEIVEILLSHPQIPSTVSLDVALQNAVWKNHPLVIKALFKDERVKLHCGLDPLLLLAHDSESGNTTETVDALLQDARLDPSENDCGI